MSVAVDKINTFLAHAAAGDLRLDELLDLKADAFQAIADDNDACAGDRQLRADAEQIANKARAAAQARSHYTASTR